MWQISQTNLQQSQYCCNKRAHIDFSLTMSSFIAGNIIKEEGRLKEDTQCYSEIAHLTMHVKAYTPIRIFRWGLLVINKDVLKLK